MTRLVRMASLGTRQELLAHLEHVGVELPVSEAGDVGPVLARPLQLNNRVLGNRFAILPMEGWDGTTDGRPSELVRRRWERFGSSGAKLIWGGEAMAVVPEARANPHQLVLDARTVGEVAELRKALVRRHEQLHSAEGLVVGAQLTHSGRFARPEGAFRPRTAYQHPLLDSRVGASKVSVLTDDELDALVEIFVDRAVLAAEAGFDFVDVKACHGYLGHELLSAYDRPGRYGGDFDNRTRFLRSVIEGIAAAAPDLAVGVRLSAFDLAPFSQGPDGTGRCEAAGAYRYAFGGDGSGTGVDLTEPDQLLGLLGRLGVRLICVTAGSPYYCPHTQRPAMTPPSDGYEPPEEPLVGVHRMLRAARELKARHPEIVVVGSGFTYLQEWCAAVGAGVVADGWMDVVGLGRMALSYPELPADVLAGRDLRRKLICRTFSECTTSARLGHVSGCYPLDDFFKSRPERAAVEQAKRTTRATATDQIAMSSRGMT